MPDQPMEIDAPEAVLQMTIQLFRDRMAQQKPITPDDLQSLEKSMKLYAQLCMKEKAGAKE